MGLKKNILYSGFLTTSLYIFHFITYPYVSRVLGVTNVGICNYVQSIVQYQQSSGEIGWRTFEDNKNRAAVLNSYTDGNTSGIRSLLYNYHRKGLDEMVTSPDKGRGVITESLSEIKKIYESAPMSVALSIFRDAKLDELVNIYSKAPETERQKVYDILQPIYPTESTRLNKIKNPDTK